MVSISTRLALKERAIKAAWWLDFWCKDLTAELRKMSSDNTVHIGSDLSDDNQPLTLTRGQVRKLIIGMQEQAAELRRFAK
jgi:hypothetical protein